MISWLLNRKDLVIPHLHRRMNGGLSWSRCARSLPYFVHPVWVRPWSGCCRACTDHFACDSGYSKKKSPRLLRGISHFISKQITSRYSGIQECFHRCRIPCHPLPVPSDLHSGKPLQVFIEHLGISFACADDCKQVIGLRCLGSTLQCGLSC